MKNIIVILVLSFTTIGIYAQETKKRLSIPEYTTVNAKELSLGYQKETKMYSFAYSQDTRNHIYYEIFAESDLKFDYPSNHEIGISIGARHRMKFGENFIVSFRFGPYIGVGCKLLDAEYVYKEWTSITTDRWGNKFVQDHSAWIQEGDKELEFDFTYGVKADIGLAYKIFETKKGDNYFLNISYNVTAVEFETKNMFDYGILKVGIMKTF